MNNIEIDELKKLGKIFYRDSMSYLHENNNEWNVSSFVAHLLFQSKLILNDYKCVDEKLKEFNKLNNTKLELNTLIEKQWLRIILDEVMIPEQLNSYSYKFLHNVQFFNKIKDNNKTILFELSFISELYNEINSSDNRNLVISKNNFEELYINFSKIYPQIVTRGNLLSSLNAKEQDDNYYFSINRITRTFNNSETAGELFTLLFSSENEREENYLPVVLNYFQITRTLNKSKILNYLPDYLKDFYIKTAFEILENEKDIIYEQNVEYKKRLLDSPVMFAENDQILLGKIDKEFDIRDTNRFIYWFRISNLHRTIEIHMQRCREAYADIIFSLINTEQYEQNICRIIHNADKSPYLIHEVIFYLERNAPDKLLTFINNQNTGLIFFASFFKLCCEKLNTQHGIENILLDIIKKVCRIIIDMNITNSENLSIILLWLLRETLSADYRKHFSELKQDIFEYVKNYLIEALKKEKVIFLEEFLISFNKYRNIILPMHDDFGLNQFMYLLVLSDICVTRNEKKYLEIISKRIFMLFRYNLLKRKKLFCILEYEKIKAFNFESLCQNEIFIHSLISSLDKFCIYDYVDLSKSFDETDFDIKRTNGEKLRIYLLILSELYIYAKRLMIYEVLDSLEDEITTIMISSFKDLYEKRKIDLFTIFEENLDHNTEILPTIFTAVLLFSISSKEKLFKQLFADARYSDIIKIYNSLTNIEDKKYFENYLISKEFEKRFDQDIDSIAFLPELITTSINTINSDIKDSFSDKLIARLEEIMIENNKNHYFNYTLQIEELKLYRLFQRKDVQELSNFQLNIVDLPSSYNSGKKQILNLKDFYLCLIKLESNNIEDAYNGILRLLRLEPSSDLYKSYSYYIRFLACDKTQKQDLIKQLKEINSFLKIEKGEINIVSYTKMLILNELQKEEELQNFFYTLNNSFRTNPRYVSVMIDSLKRENKIPQIFELYKNINPIWKDTEEFNDISKQLPKNDLISNLQDSYKSLLTDLSDSERFLVLPKVINSHNGNIDTFLLWEIINGLKKVLDKCDLAKSLIGLKEDKITELLLLRLNARGSMLNIEYLNQPPRGSSESGKGAGELDLVIDFDSFSSVIEAVRYKTMLRKI